MSEAESDFNKALFKLVPTDDSDDEDNPTERDEAEDLAKSGIAEDKATEKDKLEDNVPTPPLRLKCQRVRKVQQ